MSGLIPLKVEDFLVFPIDGYFNAIHELVKEFLEKEEGNLRAAADLVYESIRKDGVWHVFGSGHSALLADELFHRAGGLVPINSLTMAEMSPIVNPAINREIERDEKNAAKILEGHELAAGEVILLISNSGINGISVELAKLAKAKGLQVIALSSLAHSKASKSRHSSGKKLYELADLVIDSSLPPGDAILGWSMASGKEFRSGASSMVIGAIALHTVESMVVEKFVQENEMPPVLMSANAEGGDEHNHQLEARYHSKITKFRS